MLGSQFDVSRNPSRFAGASAGDGLRAYEEAAAAVGRLDAAASLASGGVRELLVLRCMVTPFPSPRDHIIALLRGDPAGAGLANAFAVAIRAGGASARGGVIPASHRLLDLLGASRLNSIGYADTDSNLESPPFVASGQIDALIHDTHVRTPPVLKAIVTAAALTSQHAESRRELAALAAALLLCGGGAITDTWVTLPLTPEGALSVGPDPHDASWTAWCRHAFTELAREARAAERAAAEARKQVETDRELVREAFGRASYSALDMLDLLAHDLVTNVPDAARTLNQTPPTAGAAVARLVDLGIASEVTGRARSRSFVYIRLVDAMAPNEGRAHRTAV
jgi:hypothetical protein